MPESAKKRGWQLSSLAFRQLLQWLDEGKDSEGQSFLDMRGRLVAYFDRKGCFNSDELADETMNRIARRLEEEEGKITTETPAKYSYITARFVFLESLRAQAREQPLVSEIRRESGEAGEDQNDRNKRERMLDCLDECAGKLDAAKRELILSYYVGKERVKIDNRRELAKSLNITLNALSIRACRIRDNLEECVRQCVSAK
jgi:DNA-directed RNA polymerase specialized sigma24 family protein